VNSGHTTKSDAELLALVEEITPWMHGQASTLAKWFHMDREDLFAAGCLEALQAARCYDPARGCKFLTYAARRVKGMMFREVGAIGRPVRIPAHEEKSLSSFVAVNLDAPVNASRDDFRTVGDSFAAESNVDEFEAADRIAKVRAALAGLKEQEALVLAGRYFHELTQIEIAAQLGVTRQRVQQIEAKAIKRLRRYSGLEALL
jgi:RNA polymerase sporulation-specific sigma factor